MLSREMFTSDYITEVTFRKSNNSDNFIFKRRMSHSWLKLQKTRSRLDCDKVVEFPD